jgi:hypothetical protein
MRLSAQDRQRRREWLAQFNEIRPGEFIRKRVRVAPADAGPEVRGCGPPATAFSLGFDAPMIERMLEFNRAGFSCAGLRRPLETVHESFKSMQAVRGPAAHRQV